SLLGLLKQRCLLTDEPLRHAAPEMLESEARQHAPARRTLNEALLQQVRLDDLLDGIARLAERGSDGLDPYRTATIEVGNGGEIPPVELVQAAGIDIKAQQRLVGNGTGDFLGDVDQREVRHAP